MMLKKFKYFKAIFLSILLIMILFSNSSSGESEQQSTYQYPLLVFDNEGYPEFPAKFRTSHSAYSRETTDSPSRQGLDELNISGSAQFTKINLKNIVDFLKQKGAKNIVIVDLRQESHGFLDNMPISLYGRNNAENANKSPKEIKMIENKLLNDLKHKNNVTVYLRSKTKQGERFYAFDTLYQNAFTEEQLLQKEKEALHYKRFYVQDHHAPTNAEVDRFLDFISTLPKHTWLHFHCRGGIGRTSTFMVMMDILRNGKSISLEDIMKRQVLIGGSNLFNTNNEENMPVDLKEERKEFINLFYRFIKDDNSYPHQTWSGWLKKNVKK